MEDRFVAFDPANETLGAAMIGFVYAADQEIIVPLMQKYHLPEVIDPTQWYPLQPLLDMFTEIAHLPGGWSTLVNLGMRVGESLPLPPTVTTLEQALMGIPQGFDQTHRGGYVGRVEVLQFDERHFQVSQHAPYPDDSAYGTYYGLARRMLKGQTHDLIVRSNQAGKNRYPRLKDEPIMLDIIW